MGQVKVDVIVLGQLRVRRDLGEKVLAMLEDPLKQGRTKYGEMRKYMERLIAEDLHKRAAVSDELLKEILDE